MDAYIDIWQWNMGFRPVVQLLYDIFALSFEFNLYFVCYFFVYQLEIFAVILYYVFFSPYVFLKNEQHSHSPYPLLNLFFYDYIV